MPSINLSLDQIQDCSTLRESIVGKRRWFLEQEVVFKYEGKIYRAKYDRPSNENVESPYEDGDTITCTEVMPVEKWCVVYEEVG